MTEPQHPVEIRSRDGGPLQLPPGSTEARAEGCCCPIIDNNHGAYPPFGDHGWITAEGCPLHWIGPRVASESRNTP